MTKGEFREGGDWFPSLPLPDDWSQRERRVIDGVHLVSGSRKLDESARRIVAFRWLKGGPIALLQVTVSAYGTENQDDPSLRNRYGPFELAALALDLLKLAAATSWERAKARLRA